MTKIVGVNFNERNFLDDFGNWIANFRFEKTINPIAVISIGKDYVYYGENVLKLGDLKDSKLNAACFELLRNKYERVSKKTNEVLKAACFVHNFVLNKKTKGNVTTYTIYKREEK